MEIIRLTYPFEPIEGPSLSLCLGNFDGVHRGHQSLFLESRLDAEGDCGVLLFDPPLSSFFKKEKVLTSTEDKLRFIKPHGLDKAFVLEVDESFLDLSKEEFIEKVLKPLRVTQIVVGEDFRFGKGAKGTPKDLKGHFDVVTMPLLEEGGKKVSSTLVKALLKEGDVQSAKKALGRPYEVKGPIKEGFHNGEKLGFPTLNIHAESQYVLPKNGVYAGFVYLGGVPRKAVMNVGIHPTLTSLSEPIIEAHLLSGEPSFVPSSAYVEFLAFEREEKTFASLEELKEELKKDKAWAEDFFDLGLFS